MWIIQLENNKRWRQIAIRYVSPFVTVALLVLLKIAFPLEYNSPYVFFSILIVAHSIFGGMRSGLLATIISIAMINFFLVPPVYQFKFSDPRQISQAFFYLLQSAIITLVLGNILNNRRKLRELTAKLNTNQDRLNNIIDSVFTIIVITTPQGKIIEANKAYAQMLPNKWKGLIKHKITEVQPWQNDRESQLRLKNAITQAANGAPVKYEDKLQIDHKTVYCEVSVVGIKTQDLPFVDNIVVTVRDLTDRKLYEDALLKSKEVLDKVIDSNVIGMVISNANGVILDVNEAFLRLLGYTGTELAVQDLSLNQLIAPEYSNLEQQIKEEVLSTGSASPVEKEFIHKDGHAVPVLCSGVLVDKENGNILYLVVDLTLQKNIQKNKDEFLSIASHELKTPMTVIKGYAQVLNKKLAKAGIDTYDPLLTTINFQLDKLNILVNELLDISKIEAKKLKLSLASVNLHELIQESIKSVGPYAENHIIEYKSNDEKIIIHADVIRLEQVLVNLFTNAIKYSNAGTKIKVTTKQVNGFAKIEVKDQGVGIPEDEIAYVFEKFYQTQRTDDMRDGLGLGLYISAEIVRRHGGNITVKSEKGKGATFSFTVPLELPDAAK